MSAWTEDPENRRGFVSYAIENKFERVTINVSRTVIIFHDGQKFLKITSWGEFKPLILPNKLVCITLKRINHKNLLRGHRALHFEDREAIALPLPPHPKIAPEG